MAIFQLDEHLWFPPPELGEEDGFFAIGGDLSPERLILAYSHGVFPWFSFKDCDEPLWYCPRERFVIFPDEIHISHSLRTLLNKNRYKFTINRDFERVIEECAVIDKRNEMEGAWLGPAMTEAYIKMHRLGLAMSVEVWELPETTVAPEGDADGKPEDPRSLKLAGGLYGVQMNNAFFGESMFSNVANGSKLALIFLAQTALKNGWHFIDCQFETPHLRSMGGRHISYEDYMMMLNSEA